MAASVNDPDLLLTTAEVGIAVAGFAGLASILGRSRTDYNPAVDALRLRLMLELSLLVVAFSLFPFVLAKLGFVEAAWPLSAACFAAALAGYLLYTGVRYSRSEVRRMDPRWYMALWGSVTTSSMGILLYAAVALEAEPASAAYFVSLYTLLVLSGFQFIRLVVSLLGSSSP